MILLLLISLLLPTQPAFAEPGLTARAEAEGVLLTWNGFGTPHDGYYLFRGLSPGQYDPFPLTDFPLLEPRFVDQKAEPGHTYYYQVRTYRGAAGEYGLSSNEASVSLPAGERRLTGRAQGGKVDLTWQPFGLPHDGYYLYRGTVPGQYDPVPLTDFPLLESRFTDRKVEEGKTYHYVVRVYQIEPEQSVKPGNGLDLDWVGGGGPSGGTDGLSGLTIDWATNSPLSEESIRLAYYKAFGREPTPRELAAEQDRQSWDQRRRSLTALLDALRSYLNSGQGVSERAATYARALKVAPVDQFRLHGSGGLLYHEMVRLFTIHDSYHSGFDLNPTQEQVAQWPETVQLAELIEAHRGTIRTDAALRRGVIERAYKKVWQRAPIAAEVERWEADLTATGKIYKELTEAIAGPHDPIKPQIPLILSHSHRPIRDSLGRSFTYLHYRQQGDQAQSFRIFRQDSPVANWKEIGTQPAQGAEKEHQYNDTYQSDRVFYKVCAVNPYGEACSDPYATSELPNRVRISSAKADSPTQISIGWDRIGYDVTAMLVRRQKADGGWEEVFREPAASHSFHRYTERVQPDTERVYVVCSLNQYGETCTEWLRIRTPLPPQVAPTNFKVEALNQTDWRISWRPHTSDSVRLERWNSQTGQWNFLKELPNGQTEWVQRELGAETFYAYRVCAQTNKPDPCSPHLLVGKQFDHPTNFTSLDYGVYWFKCGTCRGSTKASDEGAQSDGVKAGPGLSYDYFDPSKPTVIYVHGWARNSVKEHSRESMKSPIDKSDLMDAWKQAGWNVGIFYWNAFSDDDWGAEPRFAQQKIDRGDITWSVSNGQGNSSFASSRVKDPASVLFTQSVMDAMRDYKGPEFRIVGHSLGTQMAVMATYYLSQSGQPHLVPRRVALLDPWISSPERAAGLGDLIDKVKQSHGTVYEYYQTSVISQEHGHYGSRASTNRVHPYYIHWSNPAGAHASAIHWYFHSLLWKGEAPSAGMPLEKLRPLMNCGCRFEQLGGTTTPKVTDDTFGREAKR